MNSDPYADLRHLWGNFVAGDETRSQLAATPTATTLDMAAVIAERRAAELFLAWLCQCDHATARAAIISLERGITRTMQGVPQQGAYSHADYWRIDVTRSRVLVRFGYGWASFCAASWGESPPDAAGNRRPVIDQMRVEWAALPLAVCFE